MTKKRRGTGEGTVYKRKDGRWEAAVSLGNGRRKSVYGHTQREVQEKKTALLNSLRQGLPLPGERLTVGEFLEAWLREHAQHTVRPATLRSYRAKVQNYLIPALGRISLVKLTPRHVEKMMTEQIQAGVPPRSVAHNRAVLRNALSTGLRWSVVGRNVAALATPPSVPEREYHALNLSEAQALLAAVEGDRLEAVFSVALGLGLRQSEALGLRWEDADLDAGSLRIQRTLQRVDGAYQFFDPKTPRSRRTIPLPAPIVRALRNHRTHHLEERLRAGPAWQGAAWGELIFTTEAGEPLPSFLVTRRFRALLKAAGLPELRYHDLRHGAASLMAAQGVAARVVMEVLGHSQISTTLETYTHITEATARDAVDPVATALWGEQ